MPIFKYGNEEFLFRPRTKAATEVCGEYTLGADVVKYHERLLKARIHEEGEQHPTKVTQKTLNAWLMEIGGLLGMQENEIRGVIEKLDVGKFTVSCRPADIYRIGISRYYTACTRPGKEYSRYLNSYLDNENLVVIFVRDGGGYYKHRMLLGVKEIEGRKVFYTARVYGSTDLMRHILEEMCKKHNAVIAEPYDISSPMENVDTQYSVSITRTQSKPRIQLLSAPAGATVRL